MLSVDPEGLSDVDLLGTTGSCGLLPELHEPGRVVAFFASFETWCHRVGGWVGTPYVGPFGPTLRAQGAYPSDARPP